VIADTYEMMLSNIIISKLETPHVPFHWSDALLIIGALAVVVGPEWLFGKAFRALGREFWLRIVADYKKANKP
jgi:uncharacterized membrane protein YwaF